MSSYTYLFTQNSVINYRSIHQSIIGCLTAVTKSSSCKPISTPSSRGLSKLVGFAWQFLSSAATIEKFELRVFVYRKFSRFRVTAKAQKKLEDKSFALQLSKKSLA